MTRSATEAINNMKPLDLSHQQSKPHDIDNMFVWGFEPEPETH